MRRNTIDIITLGCSKNLVDSEKLMRQLESNGYKVTHDSPNPQGEIAVINTCGFIGDAKEESIMPAAHIDIRAILHLTFLCSKPLWHTAERCYCHHAQ